MFNLNIKLFIKPAMLSFALISTSFVLSNAYASGSANYGGAKTESSQMYNKGKAIYSKKLACDNCPLSGQKLDKSSAMALVNGEGAGQEALSQLSNKEASALKTYLKRRFKL